MTSNFFRAIEILSASDSHRRRSSRGLAGAVRYTGGCAVLALVAACSGDDTKVVTGSSGNTSTGSTTGMGSSGSAGSGGASNAAGTGGSGTAGTTGSGGSAGSSSGTAGSGGVGAGSGGAAGASGGAGGSAGASGAGGSGGAGGVRDGGVGICDTSPGKALQFDATAIDMMTGDLGMDLPGGDVPRTIELWAKFLGAQSWTAEHTIIETGYPPPGMGNMVLGIDMSGDMDGTGPRQFGPYTNGFTDNNRGTGMGGVIVPGIAQTGWFHLSWSYTGNHGTFSFTVDGKDYPVKTLAGQPTMNFTAGIITLGASQQFGFPGWAGAMDEVRVWTVARTPQQISDNMRVVLKATEPGLAAYYRFSEGTGTFTDDENKTMTHRLSTCTAMSTRCHAVDTAGPQWVASDIPGTFTCAP